MKKGTFRNILHHYPYSEIQLLSDGSSPARILPPMKAIVLTILIVFAPFNLAALDEKKLDLRHIQTGLTIDGIIDPVWDTADSVDDFVQYQPYVNRPPSRRTVAKVLTNDDVLYCIIISYDERDNIQGTTGTLDNFSGDGVSIMLDSFGDKRTAYKFAVSASGVRSDARLLDDARDRDYSWDGIWFARSKIYDWGFVVEMEIPYKSIQYDGRLKEWGLDFDRWIPALTEDIYWCPYEENEGQRISKFGRLVFKDFVPTVTGLCLEMYPVALAKATYIREGIYNVDPAAGIDIFYNPSEQLTFQLTANPDFAQIEADPFEFNISRYETYFGERRPFFTEGNEIFMASGRQRNSGFYQPMELFYSRRIGKKLPDGSEVPLTTGTKAFGRHDEWEYGAFTALTGEAVYTDEGKSITEPDAQFASVRLKKQILGNSSIGILAVGKHSNEDDNGVIDIDGAFRSSNWQLAYQLARSYRNGSGDFAASAGYRISSNTWATAARGRYVGNTFDITDVGFVPWNGTGEFVLLTGPRWYFTEGAVRDAFLYVGPILCYEKVDGYTDHGALIGYNMSFRNNWGGEISFNLARSLDQDTLYTGYELNFSTWLNTSPRWNTNVWGGYSRSYNFARNYLSFYSWMGADAGWRPADIIAVGTSFGMYIEGNPDNAIEDVTYNARPQVSLTPVNDLNIRIYVDNLYVRSTRRLERIIGGFLFSYNFLPKSWIYLALNEVRDRSEEHDAAGTLLPERMHVTDRAAVIKLKYLYYF